MPKYAKPSPPPAPPAEPSTEAREKYLAALRGVLMPGCGVLAIKTLRRILEARKIKHTLNAAALAQLEQLQKEFDAATSDMEKCGHSAARAEYESQLRGIGLDETGRLKESILTQYQLRRRAIRAGLDDIRRRAVETCRPGWELVACEAGLFADEREQHEKREAADWQVEFVPSSLLLTARQIAAQGTASADALRSLSPAQQAEALGVI